MRRHKGQGTRDKEDPRTKIQDPRTKNQEPKKQQAPNIKEVPGVKKGKWSND